MKEFETLAELLEDLEKEGIKGVKRKGFVENFLMRKSRLHGRPYCASFELTPLCNFDCKMCYMHLTKEQMEAEGRILTTEEWLDIVRQSVDAGVSDVDLTGGECLTHPGFKDIYLYLINRGVHVAVLTNGQLIDEEHIKLFAQYKPSSVQISIYGSSREAYLRVAGRDAFQDVMSSIERLKAAGVRVQLSITPNRFMQEDAEALLDCVHSLGVDYMIGNVTLPARPETGRNIADYIVENDAYVNICKLETKHREQLAKALSLKHAQPYEFLIKDQSLFEGPPCSAGAANFHINWKGEMTPCIAFHAVKKTVFEGGVEKAWVWIRDTMKQYREPEECKECPVKQGCGGCVAEKTAGILNGPINPWVCKRQRETLLPEYRFLLVDKKCE